MRTNTTSMTKTAKSFMKLVKRYKSALLIWIEPHGAESL